MILRLLRRAVVRAAAAGVVASGEAEEARAAEARAKAEEVVVVRVAEAQVRKLRRLRQLEFRRRLVQPISRPGKNSGVDVLDSAVARRLCQGIIRLR